MLLEEPLEELLDELLEELLDEPVLLDDVLLDVVSAVPLLATEGTEATMDGNCVDESILRELHTHCRVPIGSQSARVKVLQFCSNDCLAEFRFDPPAKQVSLVFPAVGAEMVEPPDCVDSLAVGSGCELLDESVLFVEVLAALLTTPPGARSPIVADEHCQPPPDTGSQSTSVKPWHWSANWRRALPRLPFAAVRIVQLLLASSAA